MAPRASRTTAPAAKPTPAAASLKKTLVMAGTSRDEEGKFVGFDGERRRYAGQKFYWYGEKLPSWCRIKDEKGNWVDVKAVSPSGRRPEVRRAHPSTLPGQAPKQRIREVADDEAELESGGPAEEPDPPAEDENKSGRASDAKV